MENELLIKGILIRWLDSTTTSGEKINSTNAAKVVNDLGIKVEVNPDFKKLLKDLVNEYNAPDVNLSQLFKKYPFIKLVSKDQVTEKVGIDKSDEEIKEIIRNEFFKLGKKNKTFGMTAWKQVKTNLFETYPELESKKAKVNRLASEILEEFEKNPPMFSQEEVEPQQEDVSEEEVEIKEKPKKEKKEKPAKEDKVTEKKKEEKVSMKYLLSKEIAKVTVIPEDFAKTNLPYYTALSYYAANGYMPVNDPFLTDFFTNFFNISPIFKSVFLKLTPRERLEFIKNVFEGKSLKEVYNNLVNQTDLFPRPIGVYIVNFQKEHSKDKCENLLENVKNELFYNSMYYVASFDFTEGELQDKEKLKETLLQQLISLLQKRIVKINEDETTAKCIITQDEEDPVYKYLKDFVNVSLEDVNSKQELEDKYKNAQKAALKEMIKADFPVYYDEDDEEVQYEIQKLYNYSFPEVIESLQYKYIVDDQLKGKDQLMFYVTMAVGGDAQSDLKFLSDHFSNEVNRKRILKLLEKIASNISGDRNAKSEEAAIKKIKNKGEMDEVDAKFFTTFIQYYGSLTKLPTSTKVRTLDLTRLDQYPRDIQSSVYNWVNSKSNQFIQSFVRKTKQEKDVKKEQSDVIMKLQLEINKDIKNIQKITDLINDLKISDEVKAKLLYNIKQNEFENIYLLLKNSEIKVKTLLNPLQYRGVRRSYRLQKLRSNQDELQKVINNLPRVSPPLKECIMLHYLAPWKTLSYQAADNIEFHNVPHTETRPPLFNSIRNFIYFIADASGLNREEMSTEQQKFFSAYELPLKEHVKDSKDFGKTWNNAPIYFPTNYFWKVYCSNPFSYSGNKLTLSYPVKNEDGSISNQTAKFTVGVLYPGKNIDEFITNVFTEEDFKNEDAWFKEHMAITSNFYNFCRLTLSTTKQVREKARERGVIILKDTLTNLYKKTNPEMKDLVISFNARKLEEAIYDYQKDLTLDQYLSLIETVNYLLNPDSPIAEHIHYYKNLFLHTPSQAYSNIIFKADNDYMPIKDYMPEIYLLDINQRQSFLESLNLYLENRTYAECRKVYNIINVTKSKPLISEFHENTIINTVTVNTKRIFTNVDAKNLRNICVNSDSVTSPDVVINFNNLSYCFSFEDVKNIVDGSDKLTQIPLQVKEEVKKTFSKEYSEYATRLSDILSIVNAYVFDNLASLINDFDVKIVSPSANVKTPIKSVLSLSRKENQKYLEPFNSFIDQIDSFVDPALTEEEKELVLQHMLQQINAVYFSAVENAIDKAIEKNPTLPAKYSSSREEALIKPIIITIQQNTELDVSNSVLDYIGNFIVSKYQPTKATETEKNTKCFACNTIVTDHRYRTFYSKQESLFCSRTCFEKFDEAVMGDNTQAVKESLVRTLLWPFIAERRTIADETIRKDNDIISIFESDGSKISDVKYVDNDGMERPFSEVNYDYDTLYGLILKRPTFTLPNNILEERKQTLVLLANKFNIKEDQPLEKIYEELSKKPEFKKTVELIANNYITESDNSLDKLVNEFIDTQSDSSVYALAKRFKIDIGTTEAPRSKSEIVADLEKHKKISASIKRVSNRDRLRKYGIITPQGTLSYDIEVAPTKKQSLEAYVETKAKTWYDKIDTFDFDKDLFEPFMTVNNISYNKTLIENYYTLANKVKILDSFGEALKTIKNTSDIKSTREQNALLDETNDNFINKIVKEYITTGRTLVEDGKKKLVKFDTEEQAKEFIMPRVKASPIDFDTIIESIGTSTVKSGLKKELESKLKKYEHMDDMLEQIANYRKMKEDGRLTLEENDELIRMEAIVEDLSTSHARLLELESKEGKPLSLIELEMISKKFIKDLASDSFATYIFTDSFERDISNIYKVQDILRKLAITFIKKVCNLQAAKELADFVPTQGTRGPALTRKIKETAEAFTELEAKIRKLEDKGKKEKAEKKMKKLMQLKEKLDRLEKQGKRAEKKTEEIKPAEKTKRVSKREQMSKAQQVEVAVKTEVEPLAVKLTINSEKALKKLFGSLYSKPFKPIAENTEVKITDFSLFSSAFVTLFTKISKKEGEVKAIIYAPVKRAGEKYILKLSYNGMLVDAIRSAFEVYKPEVEEETKSTGEMIDEDVDKIVDDASENIDEENVDSLDAEETAEDLKQRRRIIEEEGEIEEEKYLGEEDEDEDAEEKDYDEGFEEEEEVEEEDETFI